MNHILNISNFQSSYSAARSQFLTALSQFPEGLRRSHQSFTHPLRGPDNKPLFLDWLQLGQSDTPKRVLILICGTHGVEGFTGSAIQSQWLPYLAQQLNKDSELGVVIIHALNPWGFAWLRRYDHEGIDLNRNFIDFNLTLPTNPDYDLLHEALFRQTADSVDSVLSRWQTKLDPQDFEATLTRGQYQHADGLFFGGHQPSWSRQVLEQASQTIFLQSAARIAVIDLHTGLGPFGHGEVINDHTPDTAGFKLACDWYGPNAQAALLGESCSSPKSGLLDYFWHQLVDQRGCFVTLEFGTYPLQRLIKLSCEEQRYHTSYGQDVERRTLNHPSVIALKDFFYPSNTSWRELVLFRAGQIIALALQGMHT